MPTLTTIWEYHNGTKHPDGPLIDYRRYRDDWPLPDYTPPEFKKYSGPTIDLPQVPTNDEVSTAVAIARSCRSADAVDDGAITLATISRLLRYSAGTGGRLGTSRRGTIHARVAPCTGALYHIESYVVCAGVDGLDAGVYHYDPECHRLDVVRAHDCRSHLVDAVAGQADVAAAPIAIVLTDTPIRNASTYQAREFRHAGWDAGAIAANLIATSASRDQPVFLASGFVDDRVSELLGISPDERPLAIIAIGDGAATGRSEVLGATLATAIVPDDSDTEPFVEALDIVDRAYELTAIREAGDVGRWQAAPMSGPTVLHSVESAPLEPTIVRRIAGRSQDPEASIERSVLHAIATAGLTPLRCDHVAGLRSSIRLLISADRVDGLDPGLYEATLGDGLELAWLGAAAADHHTQINLSGQAGTSGAALSSFFVADLASATDAVGPRAYRALQLEAGLRTQWMDLVAVSLGLVGCPFTFRDDGVTDVFGLDPDRYVPLLIAAFGRSIPRASRTTRG